MLFEPLQRLEISLKVSRSSYPFVVFIICGTLMLFRKSDYL